MKQNTFLQTTKQQVSTKNKKDAKVGFSRHLSSKNLLSFIKTLIEQVFD